MSRILLLDGNSLLYRGFFAMRALTTSDGTHTNALYSLTLMSLTALDKYKPDGVVCVFDAPAATFRHNELESYKGTRKSTPDELKSQSPVARDLVKGFGFQLLEEPGFEADDVIGTLAEQAKMAGHEVFVVTGDLDALQLVDDANGPVRVVTTIRGVTETVIYDEAAVRERYELTPVQIPDLKGLKGDSSDNLPGIPGIGDKTASKLLNTYGTVENLFAQLADMPDLKLRAKIEPYQTQAEQCKRLATIIRDVPLAGFELLLDYQTRGADIEALRPLFERLEFRTLLKRFTGESTPKPARQTERNYEPPTTGAQGTLDIDGSDAAGDLGPTAALPDCPMCDAVGILLVIKEPLDRADLMTATPLALAIHEPGEDVRTVPWNEIGDADRALLADPSIPKVTYNAKLLIGVAQRMGLNVQGIAFDVLLAAYLINSGRTGYPPAGIIGDFLGREVSPDDARGMASALRALEPVLRARLVTDGLEKLHDELELPLSRVIAGMERQGVTINAQWLVTLAQEMDALLRELENSIYNEAGEQFTIGSTKQLQAILFEKLGLPPGKKTKTGYSTDADVLDGLVEQGHTIAANVLQWRETNKLKVTYCDALPALVSPVDGKVHTTLSQTVASTGRLSSSNPNLQNIPIRTQIGREIRKAFVAAPGWTLVAADYSQIELRIFAHVTHDPELVRTFTNDEDIHRRTAAMIFGCPECDVTADQRRSAKTVNFAVIYGMSAFRLAIQLNVAGPVAAEWRKRYFESYPGVRQYAEETLALARERGYVETLLGRRRYVPDITSRVFAFRQAAEREAVNMPVQGTAADIIKLAMLRVDAAMKAEGFFGKMVLQVHDELLFECPVSESERLARLVKREMEAAYDLGDIPCRADACRGKNWSEMEEVS